MAKLSDDRLDKFRPQRRNSNKHTQRGGGMLEASMRQYGYVAPMTAAADGEIIDGSARIETSATVFGDDVLVVHHDGTKPVIMVRDDIASADTPEARAISVAANRIAQVNLEYDAEVILGDLQAGVDLSGLWFEHELDAMLNGLAGEDVDHAAEWQGMPEFVQEDKLAWKSVRVNFTCEKDMFSFAELVGQKLTKQTQYIWYPKKEHEDLTKYKAIDES